MANEYMGCLMWILMMVLVAVATPVIVRVVLPSFDGMSESQSAIIEHGLQKGLVWGIILMGIAGFFSLPKVVKKKVAAIVGFNLPGNHDDDEADDDQ